MASPLSFAALATRSPAARSTSTKPSPVASPAQTSIVIPAYNEAPSIGAVVTALRSAAPGIELSFSTGLWITGGDVDARARLL